MKQLHNKLQLQNKRELYVKHFDVLLFSIQPVKLNVYITLNVCGTFEQTSQVWVVVLGILYIEIN